MGSKLERRVSDLEQNHQGQRQVFVVKDDTSDGDGAYKVDGRRISEEEYQALTLAYDVDVILLRILDDEK